MNQTEVSQFGSGKIITILKKELLFMPKSENLSALVGEEELVCEDTNEFLCKLKRI